MQLEEATVFLKEKLVSVGDSYKINVADFELASGVGINVTDEDIQKMIDDMWAANEKEINELQFDYPFGKILSGIKTLNKWADSKVINLKLGEKQKAVLGEKPVGDGKKKKAPKAAAAADDKNQKKVNAPKDPEALATTGKDIMDLIGRDCNIGANTGDILKAHLDFTKGKIHTRFPPEPNGYLHIGHAKAIRFNFTVAAENGG